MAELLQSEANAGVGDIKLYRSLGKQIAFELDQCFAELKVALSNGEKIGVMGAPARGVTFLNALTTRYSTLDTVDWIIGDDTPEKIGKYFPGTTAQVKKLNEETLKDCSLFLILAWTYEKSIKARFEEILAGKRVVVPFRAVGKRHG